MVKQDSLGKITGIEFVRGMTVPIEFAHRFRNQLNREYIALKNNSEHGFRLASWQITAHSRGGKYMALCFLPEKLANGKRWWFAPEELIFIFTGAGKDKFISVKDGYPAQFHFYLNRDDFLWNKEGATAALWNAEARNVCFMNKFYPAVTTGSRKMS